VKKPSGVSKTTGIFILFQPSFSHEVLSPGQHHPTQNFFQMFKTLFKEKYLKLAFW